MKNIKEIGSEFWTTESQIYDERFFVSGRTALDFIIRDILESKKISCAYLPSFCCHTMIEPFSRNGIPVKFYDVFFENGLLQADIPKTGENEIFFYIKYFGYQNQSMGCIADIKKSGCIIIEDATHSWLANENSDEPDYSFASYRKWTGFTGLAPARKFGGSFNISQKIVFNSKYESLRSRSQKAKAEYMLLGKGDKQVFLNSFSDAEELLDVDYVDYSPSPDSLSRFISLDKKYIANARRDNAKLIIDSLSGISGIVPMFSNVDDYDAPLCVPVLVDKAIRDDFRRHLISHKIYCPVHWPVSDLHDGISERAKLIYPCELSLVCDQRYDKDDMMRMVQCIREYFEK